MSQVRYEIIDAETGTNISTLTEEEYDEAFSSRNSVNATSNLQENTTMIQTGKRPSHKAYAVEKFTKDDKQKSHWTEIGAAWAHKDGKGFDLQVNLMPFSGRIVLREANKEN